MRGVALAAGHGVAGLGRLFGGRGCPWLNDHVAGLAGHRGASSNLHRSIPVIPELRRGGFRWTAAELAKMRQRFSQRIGTKNLNGKPAGDAHRSLQGSALECAVRTRGKAGEKDESPHARSGRCRNHDIENRYSPWCCLPSLAGIGLPGARLHAESANSDFKRGQTAEAREDYDAAFDDYQKAFNKRSQGRALQDCAGAGAGDCIRGAHDEGRKLLQAGDTQGALAEFLHAAEIDPSNEAAQQEIARVRQKQGESAPAPEIGLPEPPGEQQELEAVGAPAGAEAGFERAALAAHDRGRQGGVPGGGQGGGRQCAVRPRLQFQAHAGGPEQRFAGRCAADRGRDVEYLLAAGDEQHDFCGAELRAPSGRNWTSRRCRRFI